MNGSGTVKKRVKQSRDIFEGAFRRLADKHIKVNDGK
jgi:hypothetical protein